MSNLIKIRINLNNIGFNTLNLKFDCQRDYQALSKVLLYHSGDLLQNYDGDFLRWYWQEHPHFMREWDITDNEDEPQVIGHSYSCKLPSDYLIPTVYSTAYFEIHTAGNVECSLHTRPFDTETKKSLPNLTEEKVIMEREEVLTEWDSVQWKAETIKMQSDSFIDLPSLCHCAWLDLKGAICKKIKEIDYHTREEKIVDSQQFFKRVGSYLIYETDKKPEPHINTTIRVYLTVPNVFIGETARVQYGIWNRMRMCEGSVCYSRC